MTDERPPMSFREKRAWLFLVAFIAMFALYFWNVVSIVAWRQHGLGEPIVLVTLLLVVLLVAHWVLARSSRADALTPRDEREWLIELRASRVAFFVLLAAAFLSNGMLHVRGIGRWEMAQAVMAAITLSEVVNFGTRIVLYRRDAA